MELAKPPPWRVCFKCYPNMKQARSGSETSGNYPLFQLGVLGTHCIFYCSLIDQKFCHFSRRVTSPRIRSLEENVTEERQHGLPSLPARDPRFPQPPIYLAQKSSIDRNREPACSHTYSTHGGVRPILQLDLPSMWSTGRYRIESSSNETGMAARREERREGKLLF